MKRSTRTKRKKITGDSRASAILEKRIGFPYIDGQIKAAVKYIQSKTRKVPNVGILLGSGMGGFGERLISADSIPYQNIPGFPVPTVPGHSGRLLIGHLKDRCLAVLQGRCHLYEGYTPAQITFPIQVLAGLGVQILIVISAAGALSPKLSPGEMMLIRDHLNLMGDNPLRGLEARGRSVFLDLTAAYDGELQEVASRAAAELGISCQRGILAGVLGPSYETPAEVAMLKSLGADAVCMSTVPEVIMARFLSLRVLGMVLITNRAADPSVLSENISGVRESGHQYVLEVAMGKTDQISALLERVVEAATE
ncbi:MAG: purine-nucleoside phosphorylase [Nitrospira sp.]|nr:purine-nucleoside phosphorylase [Nitrospira sp.]